MIKFMPVTGTIYFYERYDTINYKTCVKYQFIDAPN